MLCAKLITVILSWFCNCKLFTVHVESLQHVISENGTRLAADYAWNALNAALLSCYLCHLCTREISRHYKLQRGKTRVFFLTEECWYSDKGVFDELICKQ
uniref:Putative secreted protein n=1 Tax=Ixodes ricinus TaxID=34613 RepID=A0A6B0UEQ8_IXORI